MRILAIVLALAAAAQALPVEQDAEARNSLIAQAILRQIEALLLDVIHNGHEEIGIPVLDPLRIDHAHVQLPGQLLSIDLELHGANLTGLGSFRMNRADLSLITLRFNFDVVFPLLSVRSGRYNMDGDIFKAIPLYGEGKAHFDLEGLRIAAVAQMGRSEDGGLTIRDISDPRITLDGFVARTTGYIGGGDIDNVINSLLADQVPRYINLFQSPLAELLVSIIPRLLNNV